MAVGAGRLAVGGGALVLITLTLGGRAALLTGLRRPVLGLTVIAAVALAICQSAFSCRGQHRRGDRNRSSAGHRPGRHRFICSSGFRRAVDPVVGRRDWPGGLRLCGPSHRRQPGHRPGLAGRCRAAAAAGTCYGVYTTAAKALLNQGVPATAAMAVTLSLGAVLLALCACPRRELIGLRPVVMLAWLGLVATAGSYLLFARGLNRLPLPQLPL